MSLPQYLSMGLMCGMGRKEVMLSYPGEIFDLFELYLRAHGVRKKQDTED